jgi:hypothetical protein
LAGLSGWTGSLVAAGVVAILGLAVRLTCVFAPAATVEAIAVLAGVGVFAVAAILIGFGIASCVVGMT